MPEPTPDAALRDQIKAALEAADCDHDGHREYFDVCDSCRADAVMPVVAAALTAARDETASVTHLLRKTEDELHEQTQRAETSLAMLDTASRERDDALRSAEQAEAAVQRVQDVVESARAVLTTTSRDTSIDPGDAWLYGIFVGWDAEDPGDEDGAMNEVAADHRWSPATVARLREYRRAIAALDRPADPPAKETR